MCEAAAYMLKDGREELILQDVDVIEPDGDNLRLVNIFGEQKILKANILSLNLVDHKVILVER
jgi:predicted RNA-binding protein